MFKHFSGVYIEVYWSQAHLMLVAWKKLIFFSKLHASSDSTFRCEQAHYKTMGFCMLSISSYKCSGFSGALGWWLSEMQKFILLKKRLEKWKLLIMLFPCFVLCVDTSDLILYIGQYILCCKFKGSLIWIFVCSLSWKFILFIFEFLSTSVTVPIIIGMERVGLIY